MKTTIITMRECFCRSILMQLRITLSLKSDVSKQEIYSIFEKEIEKLVDEIPDQLIVQINYLPVIKRKEADKIIEALKIDKIILDQISEEDSWAFEYLKEKYSKDAEKIIRAELKSHKVSQTHIEVKNFVEEAFNDLMGKKNSFDPNKGKFMTWFGECLRNRLKKFLKTYRRLQSLNTPLGKGDDNSDEQLDKQPSRYRNPDECFYAEEMGAFLLRKTLIFQKGFTLPWKILIYLLGILGFRPRHIVKKHIDKTIIEIFHFVKTEFYKQSFRSKLFLDPLFDNLEKVIREQPASSVLVATDWRTEDILENKTESLIGNLKLRDFLTDETNNYAANLSSWSNQHIRKLQSEFNPDALKKKVKKLNKE